MPLVDATGDARPLRVAVEGGGCSGFQYDIKLDDAAADDLVIEKDGQRVLVDQISLPFLENAVIDFTDELIGRSFAASHKMVDGKPASFDELEAKVEEAIADLVAVLAARRSRTAAVLREA